jgi:hypothetical protein
MSCKKKGLHVGTEVVLFLDTYKHKRNLMLQGERNFLNIDTFSPPSYTGSLYKHVTSKHGQY